MRHFVIAAVLLFGGVCTAQQFSATRSNDEIVIVRSENENDGAGNFRWASELSDGTKLDQSGYVKEGPDPESPIQVIQGSYTYFAPDGQQIQLTYTADENGFQPQGAHLPVPPPAPGAAQGAQQARRPAPQPPRRG